MTPPGGAGFAGPGAGEAIFALGAFTVPFGILMLMMLGWLGMMLYGMWAGWSCIQGKDFRYPWIGRRLDRYLGRESSPT